MQQKEKKKPPTLKMELQNPSKKLTVNSVT